MHHPAMEPIGQKTGSYTRCDMTARTVRSYAGVEDLRRMQDAVAAAFATTSIRIGDLAWLARHHTHRELSLDIRLWEAGDGRLIGWTFFRSNGEFNVFVAPGHADDALVAEMLTVIEEASQAAVSAGDPPVTLHTYGIDRNRSDEDRLLAEALQHRGFEPVRDDGVLMRTLDEVGEPSLPPGYRLGPVRDRDDVIGRVEAHRAAFAPSDLTMEKYERVRRTWPYRPELDRIITTEDGVVVAFCTAWIDEANASGLLEPVGTHPAYQRRGLATAVCLDALRALREAGARSAQVAYASGAALATYRAIGFEPRWDEVSFRRPAKP
jgi:GNAT superfamily N-acetyltransferase